MAQWFKIHHSKLVNQIPSIMPKKKQFVLRVTPEMYKALEKWAADEFRSTNGQLEWIIHSALKKEGRLPKNQKTDSDTEEKKE